MSCKYCYESSPKNRKDGFCSDICQISYLENEVRKLQSALAECEKENKELRNKLFLSNSFEGLHEDLSNCPTFYDGCHCTVETLVHNIERADKAKSDLKQCEKERELNANAVVAKCELIDELEKALEDIADDEERHDAGWFCCCAKNVAERALKKAKENSI